MALANKPPMEAGTITLATHGKSVDMIKSLKAMIAEATAVLNKLEARTPGEECHMDIVIDEAAKQSKTTHSTSTHGKRTHIHFWCNGGD